MPVGSIEFAWGLLVVVGGLSGFLSGLLGMGGGVILVPALIVSLPHLGIVGPDTVKIAMATSLALIIPASIASAQTHAAKGAIDWRLLCLLGPSIVVGASVAPAFAHGISPRFLTTLFVLFALYTAWGAMRRARATPRQASSQAKRPGLIWITIIGLVGGAVSSLLGLGVAFFSVPVLARFVPVPRAIGTAAALCLPMAVAGVIGYMLGGTPVECRWGCSGYIYLPAVAAMGISAVLAAPMGAHLTHVVPAILLRRLFGVFLIAAAIHLTYKTLPIVSGVRASQQMIARLFAPATNAVPAAAEAPTWLSDGHEKLLALVAHYGPRRDFRIVIRRSKTKLSTAGLDWAPRVDRQHRAATPNRKSPGDIVGEAISPFVPIPERAQRKLHPAGSPKWRPGKRTRGIAAAAPNVIVPQAAAIPCRGGAGANKLSQNPTVAAPDCPVSLPAPVEPPPAEFNPFAFFAAPGSGGSAAIWSE